MLYPARGRWIQRTLDITSASTFSRGDALGVAPARTISVYSGGAPNFIGIACHDSSNSLPAGKVVVSIPVGADCTLIADVPAIAASAISFGESVGIYRKSGMVSYLTNSYTSDTGRPFIVAGAINSANSTIELGIKQNAVVYGSAVSSLFA